MNLDDRLREASRALQDGSVTQVDAATRLREIIRHSDQLSHHPAAVLPDQPLEPAERAVPSFPPPAGRLQFKPQRLAIALNLLLVLALGVVLVRGARQGQDAATTPIPPVSTQAQAAIPSQTTALRTRTSVPEACLEAVQLADEIIAQLNRNIRDNRLAVALVDYSEANQRCRREATP